MSWDIILFDFDGTLSDTGLGITLCAQHALNAMGRPVDDPKTLGYFVGPPLEETFHVRLQMSEADTQEAIRLFRERYNTRGVHEHAPYPGALEMLHTLHRAGKRLAIGSSKAHVFLERILIDYGVRDCFEYVVGEAADGRFGKKALVLEELMRLYSADDALKKTMVMVGDRKYDIEGAHGIGVPCVAVAYGGYAEPGELASAEYVVDTVEELQSLLLQD